MRAAQVLRKGHVPPRKVIPELFRRVDVVQPQSRVLVLVLFQIPRQYEHAFADLSGAASQRLRSFLSPIRPQIVSASSGVTPPCRTSSSASSSFCPMPPASSRFTVGLSTPKKAGMVFARQLSARLFMLPWIASLMIFFASGLRQLLDARVARPQSEVGQKPHCVLPRIVSVQLEELFRRAVSQRRRRDLVHTVYRVISAPSAQPAVALCERLRHGFLWDKLRRVPLFFLAPRPPSLPLLALALREVIGGLCAALRVVRLPAPVMLPHFQRDRAQRPIDGAQQHDLSVFVQRISAAQPSARIKRHTAAAVRTQKVRPCLGVILLLEALPFALRPPYLLAAARTFCGHAEPSVLVRLMLKEEIADEAPLDKFLLLSRAEERDLQRGLLLRLCQIAPHTVTSQEVRDVEDLLLRAARRFLRRRAEVDLHAEANIRALEVEAHRLAVGFEVGNAAPRRPWRPPPCSP